MREYLTTRTRNVVVVFVSLGLAYGLTFGGVPAAADTAQAGDDPSAAACQWNPKSPERWKPSGSSNGYIRAKAVIKSCSANDHWNFQLEHKIGPFWDTVDEASWYGNGDQWLREDCDDGDEGLTYRARLENLRTGRVKYAPDAGGKTLDCPT
jgi:hypothetical protein